MAEVNNKTIEQAEPVTDDYSQRIARFLKQEGDSIRKGAEQESACIVSKAREEYSQRLGRFLEEEGRKIREQAKQEAEDIINEAREEKEHIFTEARNMAQSQAEDVIKKVKIQAEQAVSIYANVAKQRAIKIADEYRDECKKRAEQEAATIIDNANEQAVQIIAQAKERAKKQADEEKHEEVKSIMESARLESDKIIAKARQAAEKEAEETAGKIISLAQQKAIQIISETAEKLKNGEDEELAKRMSEEKHKSERETNNILGELELDAEQLIKKVIDDANGRGEAISEHNKIEDMEEIESFIETGREVEKPGNSKATLNHDHSEEIMPISQEQNTEKPIEVEEEATTVALEKIPQLGDESASSTSELATAEDRQVEAVVAESSETLIKANGIETGEKELDMVGQDTDSLYTGEVKVELDLSADANILAKLSLYLAHTPEIRLIHTVGSSDKGNIITMMLDKPIPLVEMLSARIPEAQITGEPLNANGKKQKARKINIARK